MRTKALDTTSRPASSHVRSACIGGCQWQAQDAPQGEGGQVEGEGSYSATRDYQKNIKDYLQKGDVEKDAEAAKPRSESEARELEQAEREGKSHSKGER